MIPRNFAERKLHHSFRLERNSLTQIKYGELVSTHQKVLSIF